MVSAKFHISGEGGDWFRVRLQEEVYAHGLEGNVLSADPKTLVLVLDGERSRIERLHEDIMKICPKGIKCTGIRYAHQKPVKGLIGLSGQDKYTAPSLEAVMDALAQIERRMVRLELKMNIILTLCEGGIQSRDKTPPSDGLKGLSMNVDGEAASGFSSLFGE